MFFVIAKLFLALFWGPKIILKSSNSISLCVSLSASFRDPFWDHFWFNFGVILGTLLKWFGWFFGDVSESWFEVGFLVFQLETWSRPRRRRGRRPHEVQDTLLMSAFLVPSMFYHCLENLDGVGVVV